MPTTPGETTQAKIGYGTTMAYCNTSSGTFTQLGELVDIKPPKHTSTPIEIERYDSPDLYGEMIPGWIKAGSLEGQINYTADQSAALFALFNTAMFFRVVKPDGKGWTYAGIFTEFGEEVPTKKAMTVGFKMTVSGKPVAYPGS